MVAVVVRVGALVVDLHNVLAGDVARVGYRHVHRDSFARIIVRADLLRERGVGQAVAKGVGHRTSLGGTALAVKRAISEGVVLDIGRLVIAVAHIDTLLVLQVGTGDRALHAAHEAGHREVGVVVAEVADVGIAGVGCEIGRPDVHGTAGGVDLAVHDMSQLGEAQLSRIAHPHDGIGLVLAVHQRGDLHGLGSDQDHDYLVALLLGRLDGLLLVFGERQIVRGAVGISVVLLVLALLAGACDEDHARTTGIDAVVNGGVVLENEAVAAKEARRVSRRRRALSLGEHLGISCRLHRLECGTIDVVDRRESLLGRNRVVVPLGRTALRHLPIDGVQGAVAVRRHLGSLRKRQHAIVLEQDGAFLQDTGCRLVGSLLGLFGTAVFHLVIVGSTLSDAIWVLHRLRALTKKGTERRRKCCTGDRQQQSHDQHQRHRHHREREELARPHTQTCSLPLACHSLSFRQQTLCLLSSETIGGIVLRSVLLTPVRQILA